MDEDEEAFLTDLFQSFYPLEFAAGEFTKERDKKILSDIANQLELLMKLKGEWRGKNDD